ncbi:MAG: hypothetical protein QM528_05475 [Phycisphaerales bacterium]|nr:hypothetical protein [Phycisphaerales bacterium]
MQDSDKVFNVSYLWNSNLQDMVNSYPYCALVRSLILLKAKKNMEDAPTINRLFTIASVYNNNPIVTSLSIENIDALIANLNRFDFDEAETCTYEVGDNPENNLIDSFTNPYKQDEAQENILSSKQSNTMFQKTDTMGDQEPKQLDNIEETLDQYKSVENIISQVMSKSMNQDNDQVAPSSESEDEAEATHEELDIIPNKITEQLKNIGTQLANDISEEKLTVLPQYAIDYFASQGVDVDSVMGHEIATPLSTGSLAFSGWLQRVKTKDIPSINSFELEWLVQKIAEDSNAKKEILTEAMAEIFFKIGKKEKAMELYSKLSLVYPQKSSYFAEKIDHLKSSI